MSLCACTKDGSHANAASLISLHTQMLPKGAERMAHTTHVWLRLQRVHGQALCSLLCAISYKGLETPPGAHAAVADASVPSQSCVARPVDTYVSQPGMASVASLIAWIRCRVCELSLLSASDEASMACHVMGFCLHMFPETHGPIAQLCPCWPANNQAADLGFKGFKVLAAVLPHHRYHRKGTPVTPILHRAQGMEPIQKRLKFKWFERLHPDRV